MQPKACDGAQWPQPVEVVMSDAAGLVYRGPAASRADRPSRDRCGERPFGIRGNPPTARASR
jgi:hypothetical protein